MARNKIIIQKKNSKTLKNRIYRMVSTLNFISLFVMLLALMITLGTFINSAGGFITSNVASQISSEISRDLKENTRTDIKSKKIMNDDYYFKLIKNNDIMFTSAGFKPPVTNGVQSPGNTQTIPNSQKNILNNKNAFFLGIDLRLLNFTIKMNNKQVYPKMIKPELSDDNQVQVLLEKINLFGESSVSNVLNPSNKAVGVVTVELNQQVVLFAFLVILVVAAILFLGTLFISRLGIKALSNIIVKPLVDLEIKMNQIASGELENAMKTEIILKKPVREVESLADASNKIMSRMHTFVNTLANQKLELEAQNIDLLDSGTSLGLMNEELANKNLKLKNLMDNIEQGFLTFRQDLVINSEYSLFCERLFESYLTNRKLSSLLYLENPGMQHFVDELLIKIFDATPHDRKKFIPLLPEELTVNGVDISICYKLVSDEKGMENMMVIITDITEKRLLEKRMDEERTVLKMVVKSIINRSEFLDLVKEYEAFINNDYSSFTEEEYERFLRMIHTFKGNFSQYDMVNLVPRLNELEEQLYRYGTEYNGTEINTLEYKSWLDADLQIIKAYAGKDFLKEGEYCYVKREKLIEIEKKIQQTLTKQECKVILPLIKNLRYKSIKELLKTYPEYVERLSERLGKSIKPIELKGDEIMVDTNYYTRAFKSLTHIFRNCIDHGIETGDERLENGKEQLGTIRCEIIRKENNFQLIIGDDGRGINLTALEQKVLGEGLYTKEEWDRLTDHQKNDLILEQGITTTEDANYISGRGVGMAAVKECLNELSGSITIDSVQGNGTTFTIELPLYDSIKEMDVDTELFISELVNTSRVIIQKNTGIDCKPGLIKSENTIVLNHITSLISLTGTLSALIMISANKKMAYELAKGFIVDELNEEEIKGFAEDVLAEISNTILGNTFASFENTKAIFHIGLPAVLSNNEAYVKYTQSQILSCNLFYDNYEFDVNMLLIEDEFDLEDLREGL